MPVNNLMKAQINKMRLADYVNHLLVHTDNKTILNKDYSLTQVIKLKGINTQNMSLAEAESILRARIKAYLVPAKDMKLKIFIDRREIGKNIYNQKFKSIHHENFYKCQIDEKELDFSTDIYIMITSTPEKKIKDIELLHKYGQKKIEDFNSEVEKFVLRLKDYHPMILNTKETKKENLLDFLSKRLNFTTRFSRPNSQRYIADTLQLTDIILNEETGLITFIQDETTSVGYLCRLNCYPDVSYQDLLDDVSGLKQNFTIIQNVEYLDDEAFATDLVKKSQTFESIVNSKYLQVFQLETIYGENLEQYRESIAMLGAKRTRFVHHSFQILIYADDEIKLKTSYNDIQKTLRVNSIEIARETHNLHNAFFSQMVGFEKLNKARERPIAIEHLANFGSLSAFSEGSTVCAWGNRPVCQFPTKSHSKYNFTFHESEEKMSAGSTVIIGSTGSGKTTLAAKLLIDSLTYGNDEEHKNPFKALVFDAGRGLAPQIRAMGGLYIDLSNAQNLPMNPFLLAKDEKDSENVNFLIEWLIVLAGGKDNLKETEIQAIDKGVREVLKLDKSERQIWQMKPFLAQPDYKEGEVTLVDKLKNWMLIDGDMNNLEDSPSYAQYFNAKKDALNFENQVVAFEMGSLLSNDSDLLIPIMMYIIHSYQLYLRRNPSPHTIYIDEAHAYLKNKIGAEFIEGTILRVRKACGIVELATQTVGHILECDARVGKSVAQNIVTKIFFPNSDANVQELKDFGCNDSDIDWIINSGEPRTALIKKKGQQSVVVDVNMSSYGKYLHMVTGSLDDILSIDTYLENYEYEEAIEKYLTKKHYEANRGKL